MTNNQAIMIRRLNEKGTELVKAFAYERERESLFVIGSFENYDNTLKDNFFWGYFDGEEMVGMATLFSRWGSLVVNAQEQNVIKALTDEAAKCEREIKHVPYFKQYADVIIERLKFNGVKPKSVSEQTILELIEKDFVDFSSGEEGFLQEGDLDEYIRMHREIDGEEVDAPIEDFERKRVRLDQTFVLKVDGQIVSTANPHGVSKNYFQIGGVATREQYRGRGYAKQVVSKLCRHYFDEGVKNGLLFTDNENVAALKVYASLGFKPDGEFVIAKY